MIQPNPEIIQQTMQGVIEKFLKPKFISLGMNASGKWLASLEARVNGSRGEIWGMDYTYYLVNGRSPGKRPPITPLVAWVGHKFGLSGQQAVSAAFAVANKIEKEGTNYYPSGTDLLEVLQSPEVTQYVYNEIKNDMAGQVRSEILRITRQTLITA